jgi:hypothetical protein
MLGRAEVRGSVLKHGDEGEEVDLEGGCPLDDGVLWVGDGAYGGSVKPGGREGILVSRGKGVQMKSSRRVSRH